MKCNNKNNRVQQPRVKKILKSFVIQNQQSRTWNGRRMMNIVATSNYTSVGILIIIMSRNYYMKSLQELQDQHGDIAVSSR